MTFSLRRSTELLVLWSIAAASTGCRDEVTSTTDAGSFPLRDAAGMDAEIPADAAFDAQAPPDASVEAGVLDAGTETCDYGLPLRPPVDAGGGDAGSASGDASVDAATAPSTVDPSGLAHTWPLDGTWLDPVGGATLIPARADGFVAATRHRPPPNLAYGPTGATDSNGARAVIPFPSSEEGLTLEGWFLKAGNNGSGVIFGFGDGSWDTPSLAVTVRWGTLAVVTGLRTERGDAEYGRALDCWHHVAVVFPSGLDAGAPWRMYIDGVRATATAGAEEVAGTVSGADFIVGAFTLPDGAGMAVDEVQLWSRALSDSEIAARATATGSGTECREGGRAWEPGPRCEIPDEPPEDIEADLEVRFLSDRVVAVVSDPSRWLRAEVERRCGTYLTAMEAQGDAIAPWWVQMQYGFAAAEVKQWAWPHYLAQFDDAAYRFGRCDVAPTTPRTITHWPQALGEMTVPRAGHPVERPARTQTAETAVVSYLELAAPPTAGTSWVLQDRYGNRVTGRYEPDQQQSWALKVDQVGFAPDGPKRAWLGAWLGPAGPMHVGAFIGVPFQLRRSDDHAEVFTGRVGAGSMGTAFTGEETLELDFSDWTTPGTYYVVVEGVGRSRDFAIDPHALGHAFHTYARGLFHQRCGTLEATHTAWPRGDAHATYRAAFPPHVAPEDENDYADHAADGWGLLDEAGDYAPRSPFDTVADTTTEEALPEVVGGWHDAGDFDRRSMHLRAASDLLTAFALAPESFTDGQLGLPESGNGLPDLLDEALFGLSVWRAAQLPSGAVPTWIEATSHPFEADPAMDEQPYYTSLATRNSSLLYARVAAMAAEALERAGDAEGAMGWLESARDAFAFGTDASVRIEHTWTGRDGLSRRFVEPAEPSPRRVLWARVALVAAGDPPEEHRDALASAGEVFDRHLGELWWRNRLDLAAHLTLHPGSYPEGWDAAARRVIAARADEWIDGQSALPYRRAWYPPEHRYFGLTGWGVDTYVPVRDLAIAWRVLGERRYRDAALEGLSYLHGANPLGRVHVTGLGAHFSATALHLPSFVDGRDEPVPGLPLYGVIGGIAYAARTRVYGYLADSRSDPPYDGGRAVWLPPGLAAGVTDWDQLRDALAGWIPAWRRYVQLESQVVPSMEFAVADTQSHAVVATGLLMEPGFTPPTSPRSPRTTEELASSRRPMP